MARVVIDANVMSSAIFGAKPLEAVSRALAKHEVYLSDSIIRELEATVLKLSSKLSHEQILFVQEKIQQLVSMGHKISIFSHVTLSRDSKDDHYLSLCKKVKPDFLITGDKDLLSISSENLRKHGIPSSMMTPHSFLEI
jgi:putative PIN family toxin of toxin-antitoxin system